MPRPKAYRIAFRIAAVLVGLSPLILLEVGLRCFAPHRAASAIDGIAEANGTRRLFSKVESETGLRYEIAADRMEYFCAESFPVEKPAGVRRIFVLGASTVQGRPYATETAFSTWLRLSLCAADPSHQWQVINCGGVSYASYRVAAVLNEVAGYQPDLIILYTGHNEFLEQQSFGVLRNLPPWRAQIARVAAHSHMLRHLSDFAYGNRDHAHAPSRDLLKHEVDTLLDHRGGLEQYQFDEDLHRATKASFQANLSGMIDLCTQQQLPLILACPASNLRDCPPFKSSPIGEQVDLAFSEDQSLDERIEIVSAALASDPRNASLSFRLGRLLLEAGRPEQSLVALNSARDNDLCPLRILSDMQQAIRDLANDQMIPLVDVDAEFRARSPDGIAGDNLMADHVHPTLAGHQIIAALLMKSLVDLEFVRPQIGWKERQQESYMQHLSSLGEDYYIRGKQRLEGLKLWAAGRAGNSEFDAQ